MSLLSGLNPVLLLVPCPANGVVGILNPNGRPISAKAGQSLETAASLLGPIGHWIAGHIPPPVQNTRGPAQYDCASALIDRRFGLTRKTNGIPSRSTRRERTNSPARIGKPFCDHHHGMSPGADLTSSRKLGVNTMSDPLKYLTNAQDCLCKATDAENPEVRERWLDLAESWLTMVPKDLRTLEKIFERAVRGQGLQADALKTRH